MLALLTSNDAIVKQCAARLFNAFASLSSGRWRDNDEGSPFDDSWCRCFDPKICKKAEFEPPSPKIFLKGHMRKLVKSS